MTEPHVAVLSQVQQFLDRQQKIVMKASPLSYKNARPTLKDANDGIHPQSCRKGRDDTNAQPPGTPEQF